MDTSGQPASAAGRTGRIRTSSTMRFNRNRRRADVQGRIAKALFMAAAMVSVITTLGIVITLVVESAGFFREVSPWEFLTGTRWTPILKPQSYGVLPLVTGTLLVSGIALLVAVPTGMAIAIFLSEYAPDRLRRILKPILEVLAGVPTVVYGYFALTFVTPLLQWLMLTLFDYDLLVFNALSAGVVMGLMIVPMVSSLSEDAMVSVPRSLRQASYALGATRIETATKVVVPAAFSGIVASVILAFSRAIGETMLVTIAAGATPKMTLNPLESVQAMTAFIVQLALGEAPHGSLEFQTIFAVGLLLFVMTLGMNVLGHFIVRRFREVY
jgi:phosphate transport system permease protein